MNIKDMLDPASAIRKQIVRKVSPRNVTVARVAPAATTTTTTPAAVSSANNFDIITLRRGGIFTVNDGYDNTASNNVGIGATVTLISTLVPQGGDQSLLITHYANYLNDVAAWGYFTWNMYVDSVPVASYYNVKDQLGQTNLMRKVGVDILVNGGQTLLIEVISDPATPVIYQAGISLIGVYGTYNYNRG